MTELRIYGGSDDLLEADGAISDEWSNPLGEFTMLLAGPDYGALLIHARYLNCGTWAVGVAPCDDEQALPPWPIRLERSHAECTYSPTLVIDVPDGATLTEWPLADA